MSRRQVGRAWFAATSAVVAAGLALQVALAATNDGGRFATVPGRLVTTLSFFTVQSNVVVAVTNGLLALDPDRRSTPFRVWRLTGLVAIAVTGVVFHLALAGLQELTGTEALADFVLHTLSPAMCVAGWLAFGPRGRMSASVAALAVLFPLTWLFYALARGAVVEDRFGRPYYPYEFLDAARRGYAAVGLSVAAIAGLYLALAGAVVALDRRLAAGRPG